MQKKKISIDGSAELLTANHLPRNFNYKVIIKIRASNGKNSKNRPLVVANPQFMSFTLKLQQSRSGQIQPTLLNLCTIR